MGQCSQVTPVFIFGRAVEKLENGRGSLSVSFQEQGGDFRAHNVIGQVFIHEGRLGDDLVGEAVLPIRLDGRQLIEAEIRRLLNAVHTYFFNQ